MHEYREHMELRHPDFMLYDSFRWTRTEIVPREFLGR